MQFQAALIARIRAWETAPARDQPWNYYQLWPNALEDVLVAMTIETTTIGTRTDPPDDGRARYGASE